MSRFDNISIKHQILGSFNIQTDVLGVTIGASRVRQKWNTITQCNNIITYCIKKKKTFISKFILFLFDQIKRTLILMKKSNKLYIRYTVIITTKLKTYGIQIKITS
jgi:hypothetical protein